MSVFIIIDIIISAVALRAFFKKIAIEHNIDTSVNFSNAESMCLNYFAEDVMLKTYPNMQIAGTNMNNTYVDSLYKNVQTYYKALGK